MLLPGRRRRREGLRAGWSPPSPASCVAAGCCGAASCWGPCCGLAGRRRRRRGRLLADSGWSFCCFLSWLSNDMYSCLPFRHTRCDAPLVLAGPCLRRRIHSAPDRNALFRKRHLLPCPCGWPSHILFLTGSHIRSLLTAFRCLPAGSVSGTGHPVDFPGAHSRLLMPVASSPA